MAPPVKKRVLSSVKKRPSNSKKPRSSSKSIVLLEAFRQVSAEPVSKRKGCQSTETPTRDLFDHRFVKQDCFFLKANKLKLEVVSSIAHTFAEPDTDDDTFVIPPEDTSKFRLMRSDYTAVPILFRCPSRPSLEWKSWVSSELENLGVKDQLRRAGVLSALVSSTQLGLNRDIRGLRHVVRRWNKTTHTFICAWGEFTPTLDDVSKLLRLPIMGDESPFAIELSEREILIKETLLEGLSLCRQLENNRQSSRPSFACWIRYFWGTMENGKFQPGAGYSLGCRVEALVCLWLCKFVFPELQGDVVQRHMFPLAIRIAEGVRFPLAPVFLGTFYKHLDLILEDEILAGGKYTIDSELAINFLQVFLWERIRKYAGEPAPSSTVMYELGVNVEVPLWSRWFHMKHAKTKPAIWFFIDDIDSFTFRPYLGLENEFAQRELDKDSSAASDIVKVPMCDSDGYWADLEYVVSIRPGLLPAWIDAEIFSVAYWPHRVLRQFGLDQGVPRRYAFSDEDVLKSPTFGATRFISSSLKSLPTIRCLTIQIAGKDREGLYTPKFVTYWKRMIGEFNKFIKSPESVSEPLSPNLVPKRLRLDTREVRSFCTKIGMPFTVINGEQQEVVGAVRNGRNMVSPEEDVPLAEMLTKNTPLSEDKDLSPEQKTLTDYVHGKRKPTSRPKSVHPKRKSARLLLKTLSFDDTEIYDDFDAEESHLREVNHTPDESQSNHVEKLLLLENGKESGSEHENSKLKSEVDNNHNKNNSNNNVGSDSAVTSARNNQKKRKSLPLALVSCSNNITSTENPNTQSKVPSSPLVIRLSEVTAPAREENNTNTNNIINDNNNGNESEGSKDQDREVVATLLSVNTTTNNNESAATVDSGGGGGEVTWQKNLNQFLGAFYGNTVAPRSVEDFLKLSGQTKIIAGMSVPEESYQSMSDAMEKHGDFVANCWASRPVRDIMFSRLSLVFYALEQIPLNQLSEDSVLAMRDVVREATAVGFGVDFLLDHLRKLVSALFGRKIFFDKLASLDKEIELAQGAFEAAKAKLDRLKKSKSEVVTWASVTTGTEGDCIRHALDFCTTLVRGL